MSAFLYPQDPHARRHGPSGYARHESYRDWLRDEFTFRCIYCLTRERWFKGPRGFDVDHLVPRKTEPERSESYENLVYACSTCNGMKHDAEGVPDPCKVAFGDCLVVEDDGSIRALDTSGEFLIKALRLDNEENTEYRRLMLNILRLARHKKPRLYAELMSFPGDLPNLASKRPPGGNSRPDGIADCFFARRQRGELDQTY